MRQFFWLLQDNLSLAAAEVVALAKPSQAVAVGDLLIIDAPKHEFHDRLALSHATYEFLFSCHVNEVVEALESFDWQRHYKRSFKLELHHAPMFNVAQLANHIWKRLKKPKVDLERPATRFELFFIGNRVVAGRRMHAIDPKPFFARRPHLRPGMHPSGMHPRLARALVNLTGAVKGTIVDPFCGTGGILLEAGLLGFTIVGSDIEQHMIEKAKLTFTSFKLKARLSVKDATRLTAPMQYVVTDLPYGRNTKGKELPKLYLSFLKRLKRLLRQRAVIVFPDFVKHTPLLKKAKLKVLGEFTNYVHGSLSRRIVVVER